MFSASKADMRFTMVTMPAAAMYGAVLMAQPQAAKPRAFEVASVKPNTSEDLRNAALQYLPGGRFVARNVPLIFIIGEAYHVPYTSARLSGGPDWVRREKYDIEGTAPADAFPAGTPAKTRVQGTRLMLQALLADRFQLVMRRETKEAPAYLITVAKGGPKLQKSKLTESFCAETSESFGDADSCHAFNGGQGRGLHGAAVDLSDLTLAVEGFADRPVVDTTGLKGLYNIQTDGWVPMRPRPPRPPGTEPSAEDLAFADPTRPTIFAIFEQLGLKLESQKAPVEVLVIESVERPAAN
jgi:uncharacterized protein (TIGR03435 family)